MAVSTYAWVNNTTGNTPVLPSGAAITGDAAHVLYENVVLENKVNDMLITLLDVNQFLTPDYSLAENAGMKKVINKYDATGDAEYLNMGEGNTDEIEVSFTPAEYVVKTLQEKFVYYDEQEMNDPMVVEVGLQKMSANMVNAMVKEAIGEWDKASLIKYGCTWTYDDVVDAIAMYPHEQSDGLQLLISPDIEAAFRKNLEDSLKYVEANVRTGYIGSICGVPVYKTAALATSKGIVSDACAFLVDRRAVTNFMKKGVEVEQDRDKDKRKNTIYSRKVGVVALTDATRVVKLTEDTEP